MKVFFDRMTELVGAQKSSGRLLKGKSIYLISTSASEEQPIEFELPFRETAKYLNMAYLGTSHFYFPVENELTAKVDIDILELKKKFE